MHRLLGNTLAFSLALILAGCGGDSDLEGKWVVDADAVRAAFAKKMGTDVSKMSPDQKAELDRTVDRIAGSMVLEFASDGTFKSGGGSGKWTRDGKRIRMSGGGSATLEDGKLTMSMPMVDIDVVLVRK